MHNKWVKATKNISDETKNYIRNIVALVTTVNLLGCTGESTQSQLMRNDAPLMRGNASYEYSAHATRTATYSASRAIGKKRVALIIGNAAYTEVPTLKNPTNDAQDLAIELSDLGFEVTEKENVETSKEMRQLVQDFGNKLRGGGVGLFYYSGHGIQVNGENYLIPTTAKLGSEADIGYDALGMKYVQNTLDEANNGMNLVILDACRDNPFARSIRRSTRGGPTSGLAHMDSAKGSLVAFSTAPGATAEDGSGRNGTYTKYLLANIKQPGLNVEGLFKRVRNGVTEETGGQQTPWESTSLTGDFCFAGCEDPTAAQAKTEANRLRQEIVQQKLESERLKAETEILKKQQVENELTKAEMLKKQQEDKRIAAQEQARQQAIAEANQKANAAAQEAARQQAIAEANQKANAAAQEAARQQKIAAEQSKIQQEQAAEQARLAAKAARQQEIANRIRIQLEAARQKKKTEEQMRIAKLEAQKAATQQAQARADDAAQIKIQQEQQAQESARQQAQARADAEQVRIQQEQAQEAARQQAEETRQPMIESRESKSNVNVGTF